MVPMAGAAATVASKGCMRWLNTTEICSGNSPSSPVGIAESTASGPASVTGSFFFLVVGNDGVGIEGSYGTSWIGGASVERSEDLTDPQCSFVQDLSQRCDGPFEPPLDLPAYRPASEAYGAPLQRAAVPDADEQDPGTGIRVNGDDDNGNAQPDRDDTGVTGENDLLEITLTLDPPTPASGYEYVLTRSNSNLRVWNEANKTTEVITAGDSAVLSPPGVTSTLWVENPSGGAAGVVLLPSGEPLANTGIKVAMSDPLLSTRNRSSGDHNIVVQAVTDASGAFSVADGLPAVVGKLRIHNRDGSWEAYDTEILAAHITNVGTIVLVSETEPTEMNRQN